MSNLPIVLSQAISLPAHLQAGAKALTLLDNSTGLTEYLLWNGQQLSYVHDQKKQCIAIDWLAGKTAHRWRRSQHELIIRACGINKGKVSSVLDYTCGFGQDMMIMLASGVTVSAYEREPEVALLLADARHRLSLMHPELADQLSIRAEDAQHSGETADVIYIDPMFPEKKSALSQQAMQVLQQINGGEAMDSATLITHARQQARQKVVVKQPLKAPLIESLSKPSHTLRGKTVRFDVYVG